MWAAHRMGTSPQDLRLREQDMSDMFWEILSSEDKKAVMWAVGECKKMAARDAFIVLPVAGGQEPRPDWYIQSQAVPDLVGGRGHPFCKL